MSRKVWKEKLKVAKKKIQATDVLENELFELRVKEAVEAGDTQLADQIRAEQSKAMKERDFKVTGKKKTPEIKDQEPLADMGLVNNSRLSVQPVLKEEFDWILRMSRSTR